MSSEIKIESKEVAPLLPNKYQLPEETIRSIVHGFIRNMFQLAPSIQLDEENYKHLYTPFNQLFILFKEEREYKDVEDFAAFVSEISKATGQQDPVSDYLKDKAIKIKIKFNETIPDRNYGFHTNESGYEVPGYLIGLHIGTLFRVIRLGSVTHQSQAKKIGEKDLSDKFHVLITLKGSSRTVAKKINKFAIFGFLKMLVKWPFQSWSRGFLTLSVIAGLAAIHFGGLPIAEMSVPFKDCSWDTSPFWNTTMETASKLRF